MNLMHLLVKIKTLKINNNNPTDPNSRVYHIFILFPQIYAKMLDQMNNELPKGKQLLLCFEVCLFWRAGIAGKHRCPSIPHAVPGFPCSAVTAVHLTMDMNVWI